MRRSFDEHRSAPRAADIVAAIFGRAGPCSKDLGVRSRIDAFQQSRPRPSTGSHSNRELWSAQPQRAIPSSHARRLLMRFPRAIFFVPIHRNDSRRLFPRSKCAVVR
jgi:hypothetical protein